MLTTSLFHPAPAIQFGSANWVASDALPRDCTQSQRLHTPKYRVDTTDPMTGGNIKDLEGRPSFVDGHLTIYFLSEATRKAYVELPIHHPTLHLPFPATDEDDRGG